MTIYHIRTTKRQTLLDLAILIGVLKKQEDDSYTMKDSSEGIWVEIGAIHVATGNKTTIESRVELYKTVTSIDSNGTTKVTQEPTGEFATQVIEVDERLPLCDANGVEYWHANLMLHTKSLTEMAQEAFQTNPSQELGLALESIPEFFVTDSDGTPIAPKNPAFTFM